MFSRTNLKRLAAAFAATLLTTASHAAGAPVAVADDAPDIEIEAAQKSIAMFGEDLSRPGIQPADASALTDDHSVAVPTGWAVYTNVSAAQVSTYLNQNKARLTELEVYSVSSGAPRFTVRMVANSGAYAVPGWWWYYGLTFAQIGTQLGANNARLIELEPYDSGGGAIRFAAVMVSNTGAAARNWSYLGGATSAQIASQISAHNQRLIDIDSYVEGGVKKYAAVFVANTGTDFKDWEWWLNQTPAGVAAKLGAFGGRIVKLERQADGTYNFIQVKNAGSDNVAWWYRYGFASAADLVNYANQVAARPVELTTYLDASNLRRYDAVFIDNANASTRRIRGVFGATFLDATQNNNRGIFEAYLKQVDGAVRIDLNSARATETASTIKAVLLYHALKQVQDGHDSLAGAFTYYNYPGSDIEHPCPNPQAEASLPPQVNLKFGTALKQMTTHSDNRMARGVVLRYGGFDAFSLSVASAGLTTTRLGGDDGCAYFDPQTGKFDNPANDSTAADLAKLYEGVWNSTLLGATNSARSTFLADANAMIGPVTAAWTSLQMIVDEEAAALGKSAIAAGFGAKIQSWSQKGSYDTCLPNAQGNCGQKVVIRAGAGLVRLPLNAAGTAFRSFVFGHLVSDVPVSCYENFATPAVECAQDTAYTGAYQKAANELFRDEIRNALQGW